MNKKLLGEQREKTLWRTTSSTDESGSRSPFTPQRPAGERVASTPSKQWWKRALVSADRNVLRPVLVADYELHAAPNTAAAASAAAAGLAQPLHNGVTEGQSGATDERL